MFSIVTQQWRNHNPNLARVKGESLTDTQKFKFFEQGVDYIVTSESSPKQLLCEILGFSGTKCTAFYKLSIDNSLIFYKLLTRSSSYLICLCYIKQHLSFYNSLCHEVVKLKYADILGWLESTLGFTLNPSLDEDYVKEIEISANKIKLTGGRYKAYPLIDTTKFSRYNNPLIKYTSKITKLQLKQVYTNHDGRCQGIVRFWLNQKSIVDSLIKSDRIDPQYNIVAKLETKNYRLLDSYTELQVSTYQNNNSWATYPLVYTQDIIGDNNAIDKLLVSLINFMNLNNLNKFYTEIKTIEHEMGLTLIVKGNCLKISFLDPSNKKLYWHSYFLKHNLSPDKLQSLIHEMQYFEKNKSRYLSIVASCYIHTNDKKPLLFHDNRNYLSSISNNLELQQQFLLLNVINDNSVIVEHMLSEMKCNPNFLYNGAPPLFSAINNSSMKMVTLLLEYGADPLINKTKIDLLQFAYQKNNLEIINILVSKINNYTANKH